MTQVHRVGKAVQAIQVLMEIEVLQEQLALKVSKVRQAQHKVLTVQEVHRVPQVRRVGKEH